MITGLDHVISSPEPAEAELLVRSMMLFIWPDAWIEAGDGSWKCPLTDMSHLLGPEFMIYETEGTFRAVEEKGVTEKTDPALLHVLLTEDEATLVIGDHTDPNSAFGRYIQRIIFRLDGASQHSL